MPVVDAETHQTLSGLSAGNIEVLEEAVGLREHNRVGSGLDARTFALVKIAALIALDAPPASEYSRAASSRAGPVSSF